MVIDHSDEPAMFAQPAVLGTLIGVSIILVLGLIVAMIRVRSSSWGLEACNGPSKANIRRKPTQVNAPTHPDTSPTISPTLITYPYSSMTPRSLLRHLQALAANPYPCQHYYMG